jgi:hypothetical protein
VARRRYAWEKLDDAQLLRLRFRDLGLKLSDSPVQRRIERLHGDLARAGLRFRPHAWLSTEWFSPDGVPGIAVPFYLAHPRLARLERAQMRDVEGGTETACLRLLRHETGHALDSAYRLHRRRLWREAFGNWSQPYENAYTPRPYSKRYVMHLDMWYAQSHPAEDFAETFAVWLQPRSDWRRRYARWPALKKLEAVDALMRSIAGRPPLVRSREQTERLSALSQTLGEHYESRRRRTSVYRRALFDPILHRLYPAGPGPSEPAASFLRRHRAQLRRAVGTWTGIYRHAIDQLLEEMIERADELDLHRRRPSAEALADAIAVLTVQTMNHFHGSRFRLMR